MGEQSIGVFTSTQTKRREPVGSVSTSFTLLVAMNEATRGSAINSCR